MGSLLLPLPLPLLLLSLSDKLKKKKKMLREGNPGFVGPWEILFKENNTNIINFKK